MIKSFKVWCEMQVPHVHSNGTSKERLVEALVNASNALDAAYEALKQTGPNGRDYYPLGPKAMQAAEQEHFERLKKVDEVKKEVDELAFAIDQQGN